MRKARISIEGLPVFFIKEGDMFIAYCPVLDLSTAAPSFKEANKNFVEAVDIFFEVCLKHKTLDRSLESLGWERSSGRSHDWHPPMIVGQDRLTVTVPATA